MILDDQLIARFVAHSLAKGNSVKWAREQQRHLRDLAPFLAGTHLERVTTAALHGRLVGKHHAIATVKALYSYLRRVTFELQPNDDPTIGRLTVPQRKPRPGVDKALTSRAVRHTEQHLKEPWRSRYALQAATGMHTSELLRFARGGKLIPWRGQPGAVGALCVPAKGGQEHRVALDRRLQRIARRVLLAGPFTAEYYHRHVRAAGGHTPGRLRHTVATQLINAGHNLNDVATFLGHRTPHTTRRWYARYAVPVNLTLRKRVGK